MDDVSEGRDPLILRFMESGEHMLYFMEYEATGRSEDRKTEHILGRRLLSYGLREEYGRDYNVEQLEGGKPYLPEAPYIYFNISHTKGMVVCGISEKEIGVDVEYIREAREAVIHRICSEKERDYIFGGTGMRKGIKSDDNKEDVGLKDISIRFTRIWTLKESYVKAIGKGLAFSMKEISFFWEEAKKERIIRSNISGWKYHQFMLRGKYIVSVCEKDLSDKML